MEKPITPDLTPTGRPRTKHKTVIDRRGELPGLQGDGPQTVSGFAIPNCPTTAQELIRTWGIAGMDVDSTSVKILRPITGKRAVELLAEMPISDYSMQKLAAMVGPGFYILRASAPYIKSNARMSISEEYAYEAGYGRIPKEAQPKPADLLALRTLDRATSGNGPVDPLDLAAAFDALYERRKRDEAAAVKGPLDQMKEVMGMFSLFAGFQAQMMEMAKANMPGMIEEKSKGWPDLVAEFLPDALGILKQMTLKPAQAAPRTAPRPAQTFHSAPAQPAQPAPTQEGPTVLFEIPAMAQPAVVMLRRYSDLILQSREQHPEFTAEEMASELVGFIPPMLYRPALALCKVVKDRGPVALAAIHAEMGTEYWKDTLLAMVPTMEAILDGESEA